MTLSKLSATTIVLSLVALLNTMASCSPPAVMSLRTGYDYGTDENPSTAVQYRDLKCAYLFAGLTHMWLVKLLLDDRTIPNSITVGLMGANFDIRAVICTLYGVTHVEIGTLWLLLLYSSIVHSYYEKYLYHSVDEAHLTAAVDRLLAIHAYVTSKMQRELSTARCRPGNAFDSHEKRLARQAASQPSGVIHWKGIQREALDNCYELDSLLAVNDAQHTYGTRYEALKSKSLFVNNVGSNKPLKSQLMTKYDLQVNWNYAFDLLVYDYECAHIMYSPTVSFMPLFSINKYLTGVYCLFEGIMYRLTWKFLLYVDNLTGESRENYLKRWHDRLVEFQKLLCIEDDPESVSLLNAIVRLGLNDTVVDDVIQQLSHKLHRINVCLLCETTQPITLRPDQDAIGHDSLKSARNFLENVRFIFREVDFCVIRSLVKYTSDEINS